MTNGNVDESSKMHSKIPGVHRERGRKMEILTVLGHIGVIGSQPAIYLAQANLNSVPSEGFMGDGSTAGNQTHRYRQWRMRSPRRLTRSSSLLVRARKGLGLRDEETYWQSEISASAVFDGAVAIFRNRPLAVISGCDSAAEEASCKSYS
ncbi:hypothetical protein K435DRAFT_809434 [Dendrothele bispora CBS 962.96]|uniref:Uncharacterized protein n=1 Tax=Dendrothele bispora (strain CBS 962.96) TaxID=1314807 RepID=A0A4S8KYQ0_DENBC|nr:hypothetical protein K435DRAFT_809434 [Dendrothele bispora CBS 962.96]